MYATPYCEPKRPGKLNTPCFHPVSAYKLETGVFGICIPGDAQMFLFLIIGYLKKEEVKGGQDSTSIKNVFCFETIKCLPSWLTPLFW